MNIETVYVERGVRGHARTQSIIVRSNPRRVIEIEHYGEVFNRKRQNFRHQKASPALIIGRKTGPKLLPIPEQHGLDEHPGYYFSHMLNCLYDCRYCFLQGMFRSAHYLVFVNFEDFIDEIANKAEQSESPWWLFSGYDCDSLALEPVTAFAEHFVPEIQCRPHVKLELRTKSTQVRWLLNHDPSENIVVAYSLNPDEVCRRYEHRAPPLSSRLRALAAVQAEGWPIGLRFDPLILTPDFKQVYARFLEQTASAIDCDRIHSITAGCFRLPRDQFRRIERLYPEEPLFAQALDESSKVVTYDAAVINEMRDWMLNEIGRHFGTRHAVQIMA